MPDGADPLAVIHALRAALHDERRLLRTVIDHLPDLIYVKDRESRFLLANRATARLMGLCEPDDLIGRSDHDFYPTEMADVFRADEADVMDRNQPVVNREERALDPRGAEHWILSTKVPLHDENGGIVGLIGIGRDITARRRTEQALVKDNLDLREQRREDAVTIARLREQLQRAVRA